MTSVSAWLFFPAAALAVGALGLSLVVAPSGSTEGGAALNEPTTLSETLAPTETTSPTTTTTSTPSPTLTPTPLYDRTSCHQIRDTKYRGGGEREWFLNQCVTPTRAALVVFAQPQAVFAQSRDWSSLVCSYDWDCTWALAVIACESGGNANAYNPSGPYVGLFQVLDPSGSLLNPAANVAAAYSMYLRQGSAPWPNCP